MKTKYENSILMTLLVSFFLVVVACSFTGCKSKHKVTNREQTKEVASKATTVNKLEEADVVKETLETQTLRELFMQQSEKLELTQADPVKTIKVTDHQGRTTIITGANATISREDKKEAREVTDTVKSILVDKSVKTENVQIDEASQKQSRLRTSDSKTSGISPMIGLGIGIAVVIILILLYRKYRSPV